MSRRAKYHCGVCCCIFLASSIAVTAAEPAHYAEISTKTVQPFYIVGEAIRLDLDYRYVEPAGVRLKLLEFTESSLPQFVSFEVLDTSRRDLPRTDYSDGPPPGPGRKDAPEVFRLWAAKGQIVSLSIDVAEYYKIERPGTYRVVFLDRAAKVAEQRLLVLPPPRDQSLDLRGKCIAPGRRRTSDAMLSVACTVRAGKSVGDDGKAYWLVMVSDVIASGLDIPALHIAAPDGVRVENAELDYKMRLWSVLTAAGKTALVVWDLRDGTTRTAIPWGSGKIEIGATLLRPLRYAMIVGASRNGGPMITSLSLR
jgi:hypothetical protein